jgi:hypothetical protein
MKDLVPNITNMWRIRMPTAARLENETSEAAIFARLWDSPEHGLTKQLARHVLRLSFSGQDLQRMHQLAIKNKEGTLSDDERLLLDNYVHVGDLIAILQSKARKLLKQPLGKSGRRG